jgi:hypothetical protein
MALMSYPDLNAIHYKGFGGFTTKEECEEVRIVTENKIVDMEMNRGNTVYIETYCMEMYAFPTQFDLPRKNPVDPPKPAEFGA